MYARFDGAQVIGEAKALPASKCLGDPTAYLIYSSFEKSSDFKQVKK